ncbi:MAG: hypothetical protein HQL40_05650, partial [Alphaproteobacteria bacterium]|nr:hypothetical protein [Alphaproteobacteria bacterium]
TIVVVRGAQTTVHDFHPAKFLPLYSQSFASNAFAVGAPAQQSSIRLYDDPAYWRPADYMVSESADDGAIAEAAAPPCETRPEDALALQILQIRVDFDLLRQLALDYQDGVLAEGDWQSFLGKRILALDSGQAALGDEDSLELADDWAALTEILEKVYVDRPAAADLGILLTTIKAFGEKLDGLSRAAAAMRRRE